MLKKSNKTIAAKVMSLKPAGKVAELLENLGYTSMPQEDGDEVAIFIGDYFVVLGRGAAMIEDENNKQKLLNMTPAEKEKFEAIQ